MYHFLLIEDTKEDIDSFQTTIRRLNSTAGEQLYRLSVAESYENAIERLSDPYNGIIIDINLQGVHDGNDILKKIINQYRIPVAIFTGTPDTVLEDDSPIKIYRKGDAKQEDIIKQLCNVSDTGLYNVLGGSGIIEEVMQTVFWKNMYPRINTWISKKEKGIDTETMLLRYTISHIQELIDRRNPTYETEEMYIAPPISEEIKTGSIVQSSTQAYYIVLSPPCDLAKRSNGQFKTDSILVCQIENLDLINADITQDKTKPQDKKNVLREAIKNNHFAYRHWLPHNDLFTGGYINFRKVASYSPEEFNMNFGKPVVTIQEFFVKNILNRFSAYYARQGQPDFNFKVETENMYNNLKAHLKEQETHTSPE